MIVIEKLDTKIYVMNLAERWKGNDGIHIDDVAAPLMLPLQS